MSKEKIKHRMYCAKSNMRCAVYHPDGICPNIADCEVCLEESRNLELNKRKARELVLYLSSQEPLRIELAHRASLFKGIAWGIFKIRSAGTPAPMLQLQYKPGRSRGRLLPKNVDGRGSRIYGKITKRSANTRQSLRLLPKNIKRI